MSKALTIAGLVVAALTILIFGVDLVANVPFGTPSKIMNYGAIFAGCILGYTSFSTFREQK